MSFPYHFVSLDNAQIQQRRELLDYYGRLAQYSGLLVLFAFPVYRVLPPMRAQKPRTWKASTSAKADEDVSPLSRLAWALDNEPFQGWGTWRHWLVAFCWSSWLLILTTRDTGDDYLHLTKRFAIVGASQLPMHYLLTAKSWSPIQHLTHMSHEELNPYHRLLGRIIILFLSLHASLYLNFYLQVGILRKRIQDLDVILGMTAIASLLTLGSTAFATIRNWNYRLFFYLHVILSASLIPVLYFHVPHIRPYVLQVGLLFILIGVQRNVNQTPSLATIVSVPFTNLCSITIPLTASLSSREYKPGQHIYLAIPSSNPLHHLRLNPFTIANLPDRDTHIQLVVRTLKGATSLLPSLPSKTTLGIEGPYGAARQFPNLLSYTRVLLIAGGVGATFTVPIYRDLLQKAKPQGSEVRFVWIVRELEDTRWALEHLSDKEGKMDTGIEIYLTRESARQPDDKYLAGLASSSHTFKGRPNLRTIMDTMFQSSVDERVAVLICGPSGLGTAVRQEVGKWAERGQDLFWHNEEFGW